MDIIPQLLIVMLLVFLNGFFVASEFALVAVRKTRIEELVRKGNKTAKLVRASIQDLDTFISATQLGITLASLALGWIGEPALAHFLEPLFASYLPEEISVVSAHGLAIAIAFSFITFLHIVLGELTPKTIALQKSEVVSLMIIRPLSLFATVFTPFIWILNVAGNGVLKIVGFRAPSGHQLVHSEEEIKMILSQSAEEGAIEEKEAEMVYSVLRFGDIPVGKIMIPRGKIAAFDKTEDIRTILTKTQNNSHSRFPVYINSIDTIVGFVHIKDIYKNILLNNSTGFFREMYNTFLKKTEKKTLDELKIMRKIPHVALSMRIDDVLVVMQRKRTHIAVVDGEDGRTAGIVTLEDVIEKLTGEIHDEFEAIEEGKEGEEKKVQ